MSTTLLVRHASSGDISSRGGCGEQIDCPYGASDYAGRVAPDLVAMLRVDQDWGLQKYAGLIPNSGDAVGKPFALNELKDQNTLLLMLKVQRNW